jgi:hypothetical protein
MSKLNKNQEGSVAVWSIDRIARLIVGILNCFCLFLSVFVSPYFLIGLGFINLNLIYTSITDKCPFKDLLKKLGAKERESYFNAKGELIVTSKKTELLQKGR